MSERNPPTVGEVTDGLLAYARAALSPETHGESFEAKHLGAIVRAANAWLAEQVASKEARGG